MDQFVEMTDEQCHELLLHGTDDMQHLWGKRMVIWVGNWGLTVEAWDSFDSSQL